MTIKLYNLILLISGLVLGLLGFNLFFNEEQPVLVHKSDTGKHSIPSSSILNNSSNLAKPFTETSYDRTNPSILIPVITDSQRYQETLSLLDAFRLGKSNQLLNKENSLMLAQCVSCLKLLQDEMLFGSLSEQKLSDLVGALIHGNYLPIANMLVETATEIMQQPDSSERAGILTLAIAQFDSTVIAHGFTDYLLDNQEVPIELQDALSRSINNSSQRVQIADDIENRFRETVDPEIKTKLLAIDHPEALAKISALALERQDTDLYTKVNEQIKSNPSKNTFDVIRSMVEENNADAEEQKKIEDMAKQWAYRQLSGNRLDYIEEQLARGMLTEAEMPIVLSMLENSEDQSRGHEIIARFWGSY